MKIGIVGSGNIGGTAAKLFAQAGHEVALSNSRGPKSLEKAVKKMGPNVRAATVEDACAMGEVVLVAVPLKAYAALPADKLAGKIVVDAMNYYPGRDGEIPGAKESSTEVVARHLSRSRVVKAFNTMWFKTLADSGKPGAPLDDRLVLFVAGDDAEAKKVVSQLIEQIGFAPVDTGTLAQAARVQQPDMAVYNKPMKPAEAKAALARA